MKDRKAEDAVGDSGGVGSGGLFGAIWAAFRVGLNDVGGILSDVMYSTVVGCILSGQHCCCQKLQSSKSLDS